MLLHYKPEDGTKQYDISLPNGEKKVALFNKGNKWTSEVSEQFSFFDPFSKRPKVWEEDKQPVNWADTLLKTHPELEAVGKKDSQDNETSEVPTFKKGKKQ